MLLVAHRHRRTMHNVILLAFPYLCLSVTRWHCVTTNEPIVRQLYRIRYSGLFCKPGSQPLSLYTVSQKTSSYTLARNLFIKCRPIFGILSLSDSIVIYSKVVIKYPITYLCFATLPCEILSYEVAVLNVSQYHCIRICRDTEKRRCSKIPLHTIG